MNRTFESIREERATNLVAEVCFYGIPSTGAGWLANLASDPGNVFGEHAPKISRTFQDALGEALAAVRARGIFDGRVQLFAPGGEAFASVFLDEPPVSYSALYWRAALDTGRVTISSDEIIAAADPLRQ
jgi:hypothetical protein